jgi:hypothetical protein
MGRVRFDGWMDRYGYVRAGWRAVYLECCFSLLWDVADGYLLSRFVISGVVFPFASRFDGTCIVARYALRSVPRHAVLRCTAELCSEV